MAETRSTGGAAKRKSANDLLIGGALVAFGCWVLWSAGSIPTGAAYAAVDARFFPRVVGAGLCVSGVGMLIGAWFATGRGVAEGDAGPLDWRSLSAVAALLLAYVLLYEPLGFIFSSTLMMVSGAWAFSSRRPLRDLLWGLIVSISAFLLFTRVIRMELPAGWLWEAFF